MNIRELFKSGMTVPEHETRDLHYIGEAMPVPSQITTSISIAADANTGSSPIPAREDHQHAVDVAELIQFINDNEELVDLTNYYTKAEVDALIDAIIVGEIGDIYYTKAEIDDFFDLVAIVTGDLQDQIDDLQAQILAIPSNVRTFEKEWSYGTVVTPSGTVTLGRYDNFREFDLVEVSVSLVLASATDYVIKVWKGSSPTYAYSVIATTTIASGDTTHNNVLGTPINFIASDRILVTIDSEPAGDGEILTVSLRGNYV